MSTLSQLLLFSALFSSAVTGLKIVTEKKKPGSAPSTISSLVEKGRGFIEVFTPNDKSCSGIPQMRVEFHNVAAGKEIMPMVCYQVTVSPAFTNNDPDKKLYFGDNKISNTYMSCKCIAEADGTSVRHREQTNYVANGFQCDLFQVNLELHEWYRCHDVFRKETVTFAETGTYYAKNNGKCFFMPGEQWADSGRGFMHYRPLISDTLPVSAYTPSGMISKKGTNLTSAYQYKDEQGNPLYQSTSGYGNTNLKFPDAPNKCIRNYNTVKTPEGQIGGKDSHFASEEQYYNTFEAPTAQ